MSDTKKLHYCNFCGLAHLDPRVYLMIAGPSVNICSPCVLAAMAAIADHGNAERERIVALQSAETDAM